MSRVSSGTVHTGIQIKHVRNVSNNNQLDTFNIYTNIFDTCLTSEKFKYRNQTKSIKFIESQIILYLFLILTRHNMMLKYSNI